MESPSEIKNQQGGSKNKVLRSRGRAAGSALRFTVLIPSDFPLIYMSVSPAPGPRGEATLCCCVLSLYGLFTHQASCSQLFSAIINPV